MKNIIQVTTKVALPLLLLFVAAVCVQAQQLNVGDVVVAVQGGYQVFAPAGGAAKATISAPSGSDTMSGCAFDSTYRLRAADLTGAEVLKFAIPSPFHFISTQTATTAASPQSVVFDGHNNFFVAHEGGTIKEYGPSGNLLGSFSVKVDSRNFISLDISADGNTLFYTSGGSTIRTFNISTNATRKTTVSGLNGSNLLGLRLLGPNFDGTSGFLAAIGKDVVSITGSGTIVNHYVNSLDGSSNNWRALAFAPDGTHFWTVNLATGRLFSFTISPAAKAAGPISTAADTDNGQSGVCVDGAFSAAQPQPIMKTATLSPGSESTTLTFTTMSGTPLSLGNSVNSSSTRTNQLNVTVDNPSSVTVNAWFTEIDPAVGVSDPAPAPGSLACLVVDEPMANSTATNKCGVVKLEISPDTGANLSLFTTQNSVNPVLVADEEENDTTFVVHGTTITGGTKHSTVFSLQEQPLSAPAGGAVACGYLTPVTTSPSYFPNANTIALKTALAPSLGQCGTPFTSAMGFVPQISLVLLDPNGLTGTQVIGGTAGHSAPPYRFSPPSTWIVNVDTSSVPPGCYIVTTSDAGNQFASFSYSSQTRTNTVIIGIGVNAPACDAISLP